MEQQQTIKENESEKYAKLAVHNKIKKVFSEVPFNKSVCLIDLSIKGRQREDEHFARDPFLRMNVRRGLSYMKEEGSGAVVSRRGLQKFFDLRDEYISMVEGTCFSRLSKTDEKLFKVIFHENEEVLKKGGKVLVYKTEKANGENAQVSYCPKFDAWVVASKNVSIMIRNEKDIKEYEMYSDNRYSFATLIARTWLDVLKKHVKDVESLKKDLTGKTFIGEYCGNPQYQHLVEYPEITILFYAVVEYHSDRTCLPVEFAQNLFQKHNLPKVRMIPRKECNNPKDLVDILKELAREVAQNPIEEDQEGAVVYFEAKLENQTFITSLCKLKTLEYRLYRKLREKLKSMIARGNTVGDQMDRYKNETQELCKNYKPPKPLDHYYDVARIALTYVYANRDFARNLGLSNRFLDFLKIILRCKEEGVQPKSSDFQKLLELAQQYDDESDPGAENEEKEDESEVVAITEKGKKKSSSKTGSRNKISDEESEKSEKSAAITEAKALVKEETEERKHNEKPSKSKSTDNFPKRIVIIAPPFYFDYDQLNKIKERAGVDRIEDEFKENDEIKGKRSLAVLCKFPRLSNQEAINSLKKNTLFIIAGFEPENQKSTVKKLEGVAENKEKFQSNGFLFMYITSKDKAKSVEGLWAQYETFKTKIHEILPNNYNLVHLPKADKILEEIDMGFQKLGNIQASLEDTNSPQDQTIHVETDTKSEIRKKSHKGQILVFIPIGIPGMGKTTFLNLLKKLLEEKGCAITIISSDDIRKVHTDEILKRSSNLSRQTAFEKAAKPAKKQFLEEVANAVNKTSSLSQDTHIIFLDKNHPPNIIESTIQEFDKPSYKSKYRIRIVILKPQCTEPFRPGTRAFPFSLTFFLTCVQRAIGRENHPTLLGNDIERAGVLFSFMNLYKDFRITDGYLKGVGANFLMKLPFTNEDPEIEKSLPETLVQSVKNVFKGLRGFDQDAEKLALFIEELNKSNIEFKNPDPNLLYTQSVESLNKCFQLFNLNPNEVADR